MAALAGGAAGPGPAVGGQPVHTLKNAGGEASCGEPLAGSGAAFLWQQQQPHGGDGATPGNGFILLPCLSFPGTAL